MHACVCAHAHARLHSSYVPSVRPFPCAFSAQERMYLRCRGCHHIPNRQYLTRAAQSFSHQTLNLKYPLANSSPLGLSASPICRSDQKQKEVPAFSVYHETCSEPFQSQVESDFQTIARNPQMSEGHVIPHYPISSLRRIALGS